MALGKFKSLNEFINRVNPKDINKLQLEALTKAGAFDNIFKDRKSIFDLFKTPNLRAITLIGNDQFSQ